MATATAATTDLEGSQSPVFIFPEGLLRFLLTQTRKKVKGVVKRERASPVSVQYQRGRTRGRAPRTVFEGSPCGIGRRYRERVLVQCAVRMARLAVRCAVLKKNGILCVSATCWACFLCCNVLFGGGSQQPSNCWPSVAPAKTCEDEKPTFVLKDSSDAKAVILGEALRWGGRSHNNFSAGGERGGGVGPPGRSSPPPGSSLLFLCTCKWEGRCAGGCRGSRPGE